LAAAALAAAGFSAKAILIKLVYQNHHVDATTLLTLRMLLAAPFFALMAAWPNPNSQPLTRSDVLRVLGLGFMGNYISSVLDFEGLRFITASLERLLLFTYPGLVILISALRYRRPPPRRDLLSLTICWSGIALVFAHDLKTGPDPFSTLTGSGLVLGAALTYSLYLVGSGRMIERLGPIRMAGYVVTCSVGFMLVHFAATRHISALRQSSAVYGYSAMLAILSTVLPIWLIAEAIRRIGASRVAIVGSLGPVFTIGLGATVLAEPLTPFHLAGAALVALGVALVSPPRPAAASIPSPSGL
jgi:drug/metabolite transporter (DMT)-like permease